MARLDVYPSPDGNGYLLDVQADLLSGLTTRMVVPLMPETAAPQPCDPAKSCSFGGWQTACNGDTVHGQRSNVHPQKSGYQYGWRVRDDR